MCCFWPADTNIPIQVSNFYVTLITVQCFLTSLGTRKNLHDKVGTIYETKLAHGHFSSSNDVYVMHSLIAFIFHKHRTWIEN